MILQYLHISTHPLHRIWQGVCSLCAGKINFSVAQLLRLGLVCWWASGLRAVSFVTALVLALLFWVVV